MGEILTMGLTHFPALAHPDTGLMTGFLPAMLRNPALPESWRNPANWPAPMRAEWGSDNGLAAAARHRAELLVRMRACRQALDDFAPDLVLIWGDDQYENFREECVPAFCVNAHPDFAYHPPARNVWGEDPASHWTLPGRPDLAKALTTGLIERGFDTAYSYKPMHEGLGHAFSNVLMFLDYDRKGFDYPILPFSLNSYGSKVICQKGGFPDFSRPPLGPDELDPPGPPPWRLFDLGAEVARIVADWPLKVALIASSGWSHGFLIPENHYILPDVEADRQLYDALVRRDYRAWRDYPPEAIERCGQQEVLNWMCLVGALDALGRGPGQTEFIETWIFNSSKVFLIAGAED